MSLEMVEHLLVGHAFHISVLSMDGCPSIYSLNFMLCSNETCSLFQLDKKQCELFYFVVVCHSNTAFTFIFMVRGKIVRIVDLYAVL